MDTVFTTAALLLLLFMSCMFAAGHAAKDNSLVDIAYGPAFLVACWGAWLFGGDTPAHFRPLLLLVLLSLWGVRLALHIGLRHRGRGEDFRYRKFREQWGDTIVWRSFLQIYMLQGTIVLIIATPVLLTIAAPGTSWRWTDILGVALFAVGFLFEAVSDLQVTIFKKGGASKGSIITSGLWRYSRHPNYFGEATLWWGIFFIGCGSPHGLYGIISPLTIAFLLLKVSGIPMLEEKYLEHPQFQAYKQRTNAFFPWFPKADTGKPPAGKDESTHGTSSRKQ